MSDVKDFSIKNYYTRDLPLDEGMETDADRTLPLRIRRFTIAQLQAFQRGWERLVNPTSKRFISRRPDGDEQERGPNDAFLISDSEIQLRREGEMSAETAALYAAAKDADDAHMVTFCSQAVTEHAWLPKGWRLNVEQDDEAVVAIDGGQRSGAGLVEAFGGNLSFLLRITQVIHAENTLSPEAKKYLRSLSASTASSPPLAGDGKTPAATVTDAEPSGIAPNDAASEAQETSPSGSIQAAT